MKNFGVQSINDRIQLCLLTVTVSIARDSKLCPTMGIQAKMKVEMVWLISIISIVCLPITFCQTFEVSVDDWYDLTMVGGNLTACGYFDNYGEVCNFAKLDSKLTETGLWSSCFQRCEITMTVGNVSAMGVPEGYKLGAVRLFTYVQGIGAEIQVCYQHFPFNDYPRPIPGSTPITNTSWEWSDSIDLTGLPLYWDTVISFNLTSPQWESESPAEILDEIVFTFFDPYWESTAETTVATTESTTDTTVATTESTTETTVATSTIKEATSTTEIPTTSMTNTTTTSTTTEATTSNPLPETTVARDCFSGIFCIATDRHGEDWEVCALNTGQKSCPNNAKGNATWFCQENGIFLGGTPDYTNCSSDWIDEIEKQIDQGLPIPPTNASDHINRIGEKAKEGSYFGHEIGGILYLSSRVLGLVDDVELHQFENLTEFTWEIFGSILSAKEPWEELEIQNRSKTGTEFILALETTALELAHRASVNGNHKEIIPEEDSLYRRNFNKFSEFQLMSGVQMTGNSDLTFPQEYSNKVSHINLPSDWGKYFEEEMVQFFGVEIKPEEANLIFPGHLNNIGPDGNSLQRKFINSNIMGFSFGGLKDSKFSDFAFAETPLGSDIRIANQSTPTRGINFTENGVQITFRHNLVAWGDTIADVRRDLHEGETPKAVIGTSACVFWDTANLMWSSDGCFVVTSKRYETICECDHLTSFALLMDVHNYIGKDLALEILTLAFSTISILCLIVCLSILIALQSQRSPRNELTINLCACLLVGNLLMVFVMDKHYFNLSEGVCIASAVLLHYIFLCAFMWMAFEGFEIFRWISNMDTPGKGKDYIRMQFGVAYGLPFLIVGITGLVDGLNNDEVYGNDTFCWLNGKYIWTFMGPAVIIILINLVVLIFCIRKMHNFYNNRHPSVKSKGKSYSDWIKTTSSLSIVLGLTWIFGILMAIDNSVLANVAAYIFTILNASQGILLLIFHGLLNPKFQYFVRKYFPKCSMKTTRSGTTATSNSTGSRSEPSFGSKFQRSYANLKSRISRPSAKETDSRLPDLVIAKRGAEPKAEINSTSFSSFA